MKQAEFNLEEYIDSFFDYSMSRAAELGIIKVAKEYSIPKLKESAEAFWTPIGSFVHTQFQKEYQDQIHLEPIVSGQITAYAGMTAAYLWNNKNEAITSNLLEGNGEYEMNEEGKALYNFLGLKFASSYSLDVKDIVG